MSFTSEQQICVPEVPKHYVSAHIIACVLWCLQRSVPLADVAKFNEVLAQNNISSTRGIFVTQSQFSKRALLCAQSHGIETIDGDTLARMEIKGVQRERRSHLMAAVLCLLGGSVWYRWDDPRVQHLIQSIADINDS